MGDAPSFVARLEAISKTADTPSAKSIAAPGFEWTKVLLPPLVGLLIGVGVGDLLIKRNFAEFDDQKAELRLAIQKADDEFRTVIGNIDSVVGARRAASMTMNKLIASGNVVGAIEYDADYSDSVAKWESQRDALGLAIRRLAQCGVAEESVRTGLADELRATRIAAASKRQSSGSTLQGEVSDSYCPDTALFYTRAADDDEIYAGDVTRPFGSVLEVLRFVHAHFRSSLSPETRLCVNSAEAMFKEDFAKCGSGSGWAPASWSAVTCAADVAASDSPNRLCQSKGFGKNAAIGERRFRTLDLWWEQAKSTLRGYRLPYLRKVCGEHVGFWTKRFGPNCDHPDEILAAAD